VLCLFLVAKQLCVVGASVKSCKSDEPIFSKNIKLTTTLGTLPFVVSCLMKSISVLLYYTLSFLNICLFINSSTFSLCPVITLSCLE